MNSLRRVTVWCVCAVLVAGNSLGAAEQSQKRAAGQVRDIVLQEGRLQGMVINRQADPVPGRRIQLYSGTTRVAEVVTDAAGRFQVQGLRNGLHGIGPGNSGTAVRFWDQQRAPKTAARQLVLVLDQTIVPQGSRWTMVVVRCVPRAAAKVAARAVMRVRWPVVGIWP